MLPTESFPLIPRVSAAREDLAWVPAVLMSADGRWNGMETGDTALLIGPPLLSSVLVGTLLLTVRLIFK